jgi:hypothetical protein
MDAHATWVPWEHIYKRAVWISIKITDFAISAVHWCDFADFAPGKIDLADLSDFA